ncbi:MAG: type IV-A pilus assembly ATPase PilB [Candidatus Competibacteraceae bacterium]|nr:type IV-A pilus assembly ATPase PilB [Candidatus Competibacteraceae bacterium]
MVTTPSDIKVSPPAAGLSGLSRQLVREGLITQDDALQALERARKEEMPLVSYLVENNLVQGRDIAQSAHREFGLPLLDLAAMEMDNAPIRLVDEKLIRRHRALPLYKRGNRLFMALADPTNLRALEDIKFQTGLATEPIVVVEEQLAEAIDRALDKPIEMGGTLDEDLDNVDIAAAEMEGSGDSTEPDIDETPIVRFVNRVLLDAINRGASDIHFEPYEYTYRVRLRQDGVLHEIAKPPGNLAPRIAARLKVMSHLDIAERRSPQDGRMKMKLSQRRAIDFRVSTLPTLFGEKVVLRILDPSSAKLGIDALGYEPQQKELFLKAIHKPQGMVLVTGPTGSGKTVSLYTALNILNTAEVNIATAEDPVEINLPGINQVNVNTRVGMTFANALRAFLRQDPDIIMVGEIRDLETAEIAIKAAQTGHMVLSTLHTNDAPQTLSRLMNMGVAPYNIASSVTLIIAQRLARRLCSHCKVPDDSIPREELLKHGFEESELEGLTIYRAVDCDHCTAGYKGRVGLYEVMPVSEEMGQIMMRGGNAMDLAQQARLEGISDLRRSGLNKIKDGITSLEEIHRVTKD